MMQRDCAMYSRQEGGAGDNDDDDDDDDDGSASIEDTASAVSAAADGGDILISCVSGISHLQDSSSRHARQGPVVHEV
jgi:hypothetical protein